MIFDSLVTIMTGVTIVTITAGLIVSAVMAGFFLFRAFMANRE